MEAWDLYTQDRVKTGQTMFRGGPVPEGLFHLQVHVCIFNEQGEMLIQQRQTTKRWYAGLWDYSVGGSAVAGDTSLAAAERETLEELGLRVSLAGRKPALTRWYGSMIDAQGVAAYSGIFGIEIGLAVVGILAVLMCLRALKKNTANGVEDEESAEAPAEA